MERFRKMSLYPHCKNCEQTLVRLYRYQTYNELAKEQILKSNRQFRKMITLENNFYCVKCNMISNRKLLTVDWEQ